MAQINTLNILQHNVLSWRTYRKQLQQEYLALNPHIILINAHGCPDNDKIKIYNYTIQQKNTTNEARVSWRRQTTDLTDNRNRL